MVSVINGAFCLEFLNLSALISSDEVDGFLPSFKKPKRRKQTDPEVCRRFLEEPQITKVGC